MKDFNKVIVMGTIVRAPDLKMAGSVPVTKFTVAINRDWKARDGRSGKETAYVDVDVFGRTAENAVKYLTAGSRVLVEGRLKMDKWRDSATGKERVKIGIMGENVTFIPKGNKRPQTTHGETGPKPGESLGEEDIPEHEY